MSANWDPIDLKKEKLQLAPLPNIFCHAAVYELNEMKITFDGGVVTHTWTVDSLVNLGTYATHLLPPRSPSAHSKKRGENYIIHHWGALLWDGWPLYWGRAENWHQTVHKLVNLQTAAFAAQRIRRLIFTNKEPVIGSVKATHNGRTVYIPSRLFTPLSIERCHWKGGFADSAMIQ